MASRKVYRLPPRPVCDQPALFIEETLKIARAAGVLDAYRKATGMLVEVDRSTAAIESLRAAALHARDVCPSDCRFDWARSMEHAAKLARIAYVGQWWKVSRRCRAPDGLGPGDEYYSRETIRQIVERMAPITPDIRGEPLVIVQETRRGGARVRTAGRE